MVRSYFWEKSLINAIEYVCFIAFVFSARESWVIIVWSLLGLLAILFTDRKYFPYFSYLTISADYVERRMCGITILRLPMEKIYFRRCQIGSIDFAVFSTEPAERCSQIGITYLARKGRAIIYPLTPKMEVDLSELFDFPEAKVADAAMSDDFEM